MTKLILALTLAFAVPMIATSAQAGGKQNHHCVKDGATLEKTHKECTKEGGKWTKDDPAAAAPKAEKDPPAAKTAAPEEKKNPSDPTTK